MTVTMVGGGTRVTPLGELIGAQRERLGMSYGDMARKSRGKLTRGRFQQLATEPLTELPRVDTLRTLAYVLDVPVSVVVDACLETLGLRRSQYPQSRWLLRAQAAEDLPERTRRALEAQIDALFDLYRNEDDSG